VGWSRQGLAECGSSGTLEPGQRFRGSFSRVEHVHVLKTGRLHRTASRYGLGHPTHNSRRATCCISHAFCLSTCSPSTPCLASATPAGFHGPARDSFAEVRWPVILQPGTQRSAFGFDSFSKLLLTSVQSLMWRAATGPSGLGGRRAPGFSGDSGGSTRTVPACGVRLFTAAGG